MANVEAATMDLLRDSLDLEGRVNRNPYGMMAGALGVGFVLGGGIFTRLGARVVGAGVRLGLMAALPLLQRQARRIIEQSFDNLDANTNGGG
jgi:hypothetical protein